MEKELSLLAIYRLLLSKLKWILASIGSLVLVAVLASVFFIKPAYRSTTQLLVSPKELTTNLSLNQLQTNTELMKTFKSIIFSDEILEHVAQRVNYDLTAEEVRALLSVTISGDAQAFSISATTKDANLSAEIANTTAQIFQEELDNYYKSNLTTKVISVAKPNATPYSPNIRNNVVTAALLGALLSSFYFLMTELVTNKLTSWEKLDEKGWNRLGSYSLPHLQAAFKGADQSEQARKGMAKRKAITQAQINEALDDMAEIKSKLQLQMKDNETKAMMFAAPSPESGTTALICQLASAWAKDGKRVLLVDANLRHPSLHNILKVENVNGLGDSLEKGSHLLVHQAPQEGLEVITSGQVTSHYGDLLSSQKMASLIDLWQGHYDLVLLDAPALEGAPDTKILATLVSQLVLVAKKGHTDLQQIQDVDQFMKDYGTQLLGYVFVTE